MSVVPRKQVEKIEFYENHVPTWNTNAVAIGTTVATVTDLDTKTDAARAALTARADIRRGGRLFLGRTRRRRRLDGPARNGPAFGIASVCHARIMVRPRRKPDRAQIPQMRAAYAISAQRLTKRKTDRQA